MAAPISVHRLDAGGGRRVTARRQDGEHILGMAYRDADVVEFLRRAGLPEAEELLDDPETVEWLVDRPHEWTAA
ncbi:hypothetical protein [Streptomyces sp. UNOC14_S4]|uniref:hypothetical protein n=1 Tax=Streptomyces sp. UNOC14_S4 TaxID=2872340 RepID=UPI001E412CFE|nr:hypothetical protein [Streptomyces sp. UNOC14_S4]MCC3769588.1 hypothetical protein [Streptomyces sp. UNOC14_S4]